MKTAKTQQRITTQKEGINQNEEPIITVYQIGFRDGKAQIQWNIKEGFPLEIAVNILKGIIDATQQVIKNHQSRILTVSGDVLSQLRKPN